MVRRSGVTDTTYDRIALIYIYITRYWLTLLNLSKVNTFRSECSHHFGKLMLLCRWLYSIYLNVTVKRCTVKNIWHKKFFFAELSHSRYSGKNYQVVAVWRTRTLVWGGNINFGYWISPIVCSICWDIFPVVHFYIEYRIVSLLNSFYIKIDSNVKIWSINPTKKNSPISDKNAQCRMSDIPDISTMSMPAKEGIYYENSM